MHHEGGQVGRWISAKGFNDRTQSLLGVAAVIVADEADVGTGMTQAVVAVAAQAAALKVHHLDVVALQSGRKGARGVGGAVLPRHHIADVGGWRQHQPAHIVDAAVDSAHKQLQCHDFSSSWFQKCRWRSATTWAALLRMTNSRLSRLHCGNCDFWWMMDSS